MLPYCTVDIPPSNLQMQLKLKLCLVHFFSFSFSPFFSKYHWRRWGRWWWRWRCNTHVTFVFLLSLSHILLPTSLFLSSSSTYTCSSSSLPFATSSRAKLHKCMEGKWERVEFELQFTRLYSQLTLGWLFWLLEFKWMRKRNVHRRRWHGKEGESKLMKMWMRIKMKYEKGYKYIRVKVNPE